MRDIILSGAKGWGLSPTEEALDRLERFAGLLIEKNRVMNLTAITEPEEIARRHFLDCMFLLTTAKLAGRIIDVGCGAGFPTMPLLCCQPELDITALDSTQKRVDFIACCCGQLGLEVTALCTRAEEAAAAALRESFDTATSRAVAPMNILAELCLPFVKVGGHFVAMKLDSPEAGAEIRDAAAAIGLLGGRLDALIPYEIPGLDSRHQLVVIEKIRPTPDKFPRRFAKIKDKPL